MLGNPHCTLRYLQDMLSTSCIQGKYTLYTALPTGYVVDILYTGEIHIVRCATYRICCRHPVYGENTHCTLLYLQYMLSTSCIQGKYTLYTALSYSICCRHSVHRGNTHCTLLYLQYMLSISCIQGEYTLYAALPMCWSTSCIQGKYTLYAALPMLVDILYIGTFRDSRSISTSGKAVSDRQGYLSTSYMAVSHSQGYLSTSYMAASHSQGYLSPSCRAVRDRNGSRDPIHHRNMFN